MSRRSTLVQAPPRKLFTLQQANRALPLVRRIVADVVTQYRALERLLEQRKFMARRQGPASVAELSEEIARGAQRLRDLIEEVNAVGCELKDWESGLVDFRAQRQGSEVYLCWKLGEDTIRYWHGLHAGAIGRQPIDAAFQQGGSTRTGRHLR